MIIFWHAQSGCELKFNYRNRVKFALYMGLGTNNLTFNTIKSIFTD